MIKAGNAVRGVRTPVLLLMVASLAACGGDSATESSGSGPYTVGGTVTGVASGSMISISNRVNQQLANQKNRMSLRINTAYIFPETVASGDTYQVVVEDDPLNQRCTVSNGSGLVSGDVNNVNIHCVSPPQYSIGGNVSGLSGSLMLKINGAEAITLLADSPYTFPTRLMSGTEYQVAVYNEPANQDCTVSNGTGTLNSHVANVSVNCVSDSWVHPAHLAVNISPDGENAMSPQVAMDDNGNTVVVWYQFDGVPLPPNVLPRTQIYMSDYNITTPDAWTHPADLTDHISFTGQSAINPQVAIGRDQTNTFDEVVIVWSQKDTVGNNSQLFMSEYRANSWSHPAGLTSGSYINPLGSFIYDNPQVAMDDRGNAIIAWTQDSGVGIDVDKPQLYVSEYRGGIWSHPGSRSADTFSQTGRPVRFTPAVAMGRNPATGSDDAVVVWRQHSGGASGAFLIHRREYRGGAWSAVPDPQFSSGDAITPFQSDNLSSPRVAMDNNGNAIIVWEQAVQETQPHPYFPGASPVDITHVFKSEYRERLVPDPPGPDILVWSWLGPVDQFDNISQSGLSVQSPDVVMNESGEAMITWRQEDNSRKQRIFKSEYRASEWTHPISLADNISLGDEYGVAGYDVAMADNGDAIIAWRQFDGFKYSVYKSEYRVSEGVWRNPKGVMDAISSEVSSPIDCDERGVDCFPASVSSDPMIAMDNSAAPGDALILWSQSDIEATTLPAAVTQKIFKSELR
ncbi:MAG: hypothetical protein L3J89_04520 [Gammaproteobacteria bacterium]|nr:hypothetical protein [Gammaproteobacteria bacterium]